MGYDLAASLAASTSATSGGIKFGDRTINFGGSGGPKWLLPVLIAAGVALAAIFLVRR